MYIEEAVQSRSICKTDEDEDEILNISMLLRLSSEVNVGPPYDLRWSCFWHLLTPVLCIHFLADKII